MRLECVLLHQLTTRETHNNVKVKGEVHPKMKMLGFHKTSLELQGKESVAAINEQPKEIKRHTRLAWSQVATNPRDLKLDLKLFFSSKLNTLVRILSEVLSLTAHWKCCNTGFLWSSGLSISTEGGDDDSIFGWTVPLRPQYAWLHRSCYANLQVHTLRNKGSTPDVSGRAAVFSVGLCKTVTCTKMLHNRINTTKNIILPV